MIEDIDTAIMAPKVIDATEKFKRRRGKWCQHNGRITYCEEQRTIECDHCGAILDPFDWIVQLAQREEKYLDGLRNARKEWDRLMKSNEELARRERNARSRVRRWERRADLCENGLPKIPGMGK